MKRIVIGPGVVEWVASQMTRPGQYENSPIGIGIRDGKGYLAGVVYEGYNGVNINMHVAAARANWMTRQYLYICFHYPFVQLACTRISAFVEDENEAALRFDKHLGFTEECRLERAYERGDIVVLRMFKEDCKWLRMRPPINKELH